MKQNQTKKWWILAVIILIGLVIAANLGGDEISNSENKKGEKEKLQTISAKKLYTAYEVNEINADQSFKGKPLYVTGVVETIKKDFRDNILYITLKTGQTLTSVNCYFNNKNAAAKLQKEEKVTFKGICEGLQFTTVIIKNCELAKNLRD